MARVRIAGVWYELGELTEYPLSRCHSVQYQGGVQWTVAFGTSLLELSNEEGNQLLRAAPEPTDEFPEFVKDSRS